MKSLYLFINFFTIIIPFVFSFHPKIKFYKFFIPFIKSNILTALVFIIWDIYFTNIGVWGFSKKYTLGYSFGGLPLEEIMFFVCIPFSCIFTYFCLNKFFKLSFDLKSGNLIYSIFAFILIFEGIFLFNKAYSSLVFISLGIFLILLILNKKTLLITKILSIYLVLLLPFLVVNGILTGIITHEPVVWYNNLENLNLRIITIPVEDIFYGLLLFSLNVVLFEFFNQKRLIKL